MICTTWKIVIVTNRVNVIGVHKPNYVNENLKIDTDVSPALRSINECSNVTSQELPKIYLID